MRLTDVQVRAFGPLKDVDITGISGDFVVVYGPNEAGKSSLFELICALLYGLYKDSSLLYVPWNDEALELSGDMQLRSGEKVSVYRKWASSAQGRVTVGGVRKSIANKTLSFAGHIPRELYRELYMIDCERLRFPPEGWDSLQELLMSGLGLSFLRPASQVASELVDEAKKLWSRHGNAKTKDKAYEQELKRLRSERRQAKQNDDELRQCVVHKQQLEDELTLVRNDLAEVRTVLKLIPLSKQIKRIDDLRARAGDMKEIEGLPSDPRQALAELVNEEDKLAERLEQLEEDADSQQRIISEVHAQYQKVLEQSSDIRSLIADSTGLLQAIASEQQLLLDEHGQQTRAQTAVQDLAPTAELTEIADRVVDINWTELKHQVSRWREVNIQRAGAQQELCHHHAVSGALLPPIGVFIMLSLASVAAGIISGLLGVQWLVAPALTAAVLSSAGGLFSWWAGQRREMAVEQRRTAEDKYNRLEQQWQARQGKIRELLTGIPVSPVYLEGPDEDLVIVIREARDCIERWRSVREQVQQNREIVDSGRGRIREIAVACGLSEKDDVAVLVAQLSEALDDANTAKGRVVQVEESLQSIYREINQLNDGLVRIRAERDKLEKALSAIGDGNLQQGSMSVQERWEAFVLASQLEEELLREGHDIDGVRGEIERLAVCSDMEYQEQMEMKYGALEGRRDQLLAEISTVAARIDALVDSETVAVIDGRINHMLELRRDVQERRDRLVLLSQAVAIGDRLFREQHQPDVLRRAGEYLRIITGGRYDSMSIEEQSQRVVLYIHDAGGRLLPVDKPLSRGTRDQVFLALRLAICDHLDEGYEPLPLTLDEVLINWDQERRQQGIQILKSAAAARQVLLFTCHRWLARELVTAGAELIELTS